MRTPPLTALFFLFFALPCQAVQTDTDDPIVALRHHALVDALNTGNAESVRTFVLEHYAPETDVDREVWYWASVHREMGPLVFMGLQAERMGDTERTVYWYRGVVTGAWTGIDLGLEDGQDRRIRRRGVRRGVRPALAGPRSAVAAAALADSLEALLRAAEAGGYFSGVVMVARNDETIFQGAYGFADVAGRTRNRIETPIALASVSKMFTGVAVLQLIARGDLSLETPIAQFFPEYPEHIARQVTVRHLLTHTSGIEIDDYQPFNDALRHARSVEDLLRTQVEYIEHLNGGTYNDFRPLTQFDYTNEGIDLLGGIIERVSGESWGDYLRRHVFQQAEMTSAGTDQLSPVPGLAVPHTLVRTPADGAPGSRRPIGAQEGPAGWPIRPAGSAYASAGDMLRFFHALQDGRLLPPNLLEQATTSQVELPAPPGLDLRRGYGFTFSIREAGDAGPAVGHSGGAPGMSTVTEFYPDSGYIVIVLSNYDRAAWWVDMRIQELIGVFGP